MSDALCHELAVAAGLQHGVHGLGATVGFTIGVPVVFPVFEPKAGSKRGLPGVGGRTIRHEQALDRRLVLQAAEADMEVGRVRCSRKAHCCATRSTASMQSCSAEAGLSSNTRLASS